MGFDTARNGAMNLLLSAFDCEPYRGSEYGVGWHWALELARLGIETWVLTRAIHRDPIEAGLKDLPDLPNLHFLYYDLPRWTRWWKGGPRGIYLYNLFWQWGAYRKARRIHAQKPFDRVQHITFGGIRAPSFMGFLGIPFIFGPVGGGEVAPWRLRRGYGLRGWLRDALRSLSNFAIRFDPFMRQTFKTAEVIYIKTSQSLKVIPRQFRDKVRSRLEIGVYPPSPEILGIDSRDRSNADSFQVLYVGRFLYWKGMHLGFRAFGHLAARCPETSLTMVGAGSDEARWRKIAETLGCAARITWIPWVTRQTLSSIYAEHDVLLFPSLHDSSGNVVLEALAHGLPLVCLDLGGPAMIADERCARIVSTKGRGEAEVSQALAEALSELANDVDLRRTLSEGARKRAAELTWANQVRSVYAEFGVSDADCVD